MQIRRLQASFGKLNHDSLELAPGLNVICGGNEAGKSTWCAFLRVMLYGLPTRERGELADKNRYLPRSGQPMSGTLLFKDSDRSVTLTRHTLRPDAPMAVFSAVYTDTAAPVPELTAASCGIALTGVSREVFERTAFIRQCGMAFQPDATLQQQAATFLAGDSDSFPSAYDRLKKQQNARQHNRTGAIPRLDADIADLQATLREIRQLADRQAADQSTLPELEQQRDRLEALLAQHDAADRAAPQLAAQQELAQAKAQVSALSAAMGELPPPEDLLALQDALAGTELLQQNLQAAQEDCLRTEAALRSSAPCRSRTLPSVIAAAALAALAAGALLPSSPLFTLGAAALLLSILWLLLRRSKASASSRQAETAHQSACALRDALQSNLEATQRDILSQVRRFQPEVGTPAGCRRCIDEGLARYAALEQATAAADAALQRLRNFPTDLPPRPAEPHALLEEQHSALSLRISELRRAIHTGQGRILALGDVDTLQAELEAKQAQRQRLQQEYEAISLAMTALSAADAVVHQQFAPALAEKTAKIFTKLTQRKYNKVLLTQELTPTAQEGSAAPALSAPLLSQGTGDQLYLALRLALCQSVLPEEKAVPIVLDDALVHFDDQRMAAALEVLLELAQNRQILLFTCQRREADWLRQHHPGRFHSVTLL